MQGRSTLRCAAAFEMRGVDEEARVDYGERFERVANVVRNAPAGSNGSPVSCSESSLGFRSSKRLRCRRCARANFAKVTTML